MGASNIRRINRVGFTNKDKTIGEQGSFTGSIVLMLSYVILMRCFFSSLRVQNGYSTPPKKVFWGGLKGFLYLLRRCRRTLRGLSFAASFEVFLSSPSEPRMSSLKQFISVTSAR